MAEEKEEMRRKKEKGGFNIKISARAWELLRWAKFELGMKSYSHVIVHLASKINNRERPLQKAMKNFDPKRHRIKSKEPVDEGKKTYEKPKTIVLQPAAHRVLAKLKVESNEPAYTFSDAIEFLIKQEPKVWNNIPERFKK